MITVLMNVEGVLADTRSDSIVTNDRIMEGLYLWQALKEHNQMLFYTTGKQPDRVRFWLQRESFGDPEALFELTGTIGELITDVRFKQYDLRMLISADPVHILGAYESGVQGLLFVHPSYGRPEFRPDYANEPRPWDSLVENVVADRMKLQTDGRLGREV